MGALPRNMNFAIRSEVMRLFPENHRVNVAVSRDNTRLANKDARQGRSLARRNPRPGLWRRQRRIGFQYPPIHAMAEKNPAQAETRAGC